MTYKTVLVVTDKYVPSISGGAEISLYNILGQMNHHDIRVVIAALTDGRYQVKKEFYKNRTVYRVPFNDSWPISVESAGFVRKVYRLVKFFVRNFSLGNYKSLYRVTFAALIRRKWPKNYGLLPLMDADFLVASRTISILKNIISEVEPDLIHADNFRSIVLANNLDVTIPVLSYVRDNRFYCSHKNQAMNIKGVVCNVCSYGCVEGKLPKWFEVKVKGMMEDTRATRVKALSKSSTVVVTSNFLKNQVESLEMGSDVVKIPNLIESMDEIDAIQRGVEISSVPEILCVGMIGHNKGQMVLMNILDGLSKRVGDFKVVIAGRGRMSDDLKSIAESKGMLDRVHVTGFLSRTELYRCYARSYCVAAPTIWPEPFGRVPFEAAASAKPIVAYSVGGLPENIIHGETGLLVEPKNEKKFEDALVQLLSDRALADDLGKNARKELEQKLSLQKSAERLLEEWNYLVKA